MSLKPFEMGTLEIRLRWIVVVRIFWMLFIPLFIALLFNNWVIKVIVYLVTAFLFWTLVGSWGHSVIALMTGLLPLYLYFEIEAAPDWLSSFAGVLPRVRFE